LLKPKTVLALVVVLVVAGLALRGLLGAGRPEREPPTKPGAAPEASRRELSPVAVLEPAGPPPTSEPVGPNRTEPIPPTAHAPTPAGPTWWGRAVDAENGKPLARASFAVFREAPSGIEVFARAERDGHIVAPVSTWNEEVVGVRAPGYATAYAVASGAHRSRDDPQVVRLWRGATLALRVLGAGATRVTVTTPDHELLQAEGEYFLAWTDFVWGGQWKRDGTFECGPLPARVRLTVEAESGSWHGKTRELTLEPGERLELVWPIGGELTLAGRALDAEGVPVGGLELWIIAGKLPRRNLALEDERRAFAMTSTGLDGSFAFAGLVPGRYHVGPAASQRILVPLATAFQLQEAVDEVVLNCLSGVRIRGTVRTADGRPITKVAISASAPGMLFSGTADEDGTFTLGPLAPGRYEVVAREGERASASVAAQGGDADLELVLSAPDGAPR
jgi:carboxypeptidase family protein